MSSPASDKRESPTLMTLPQEILDMMLGFAYNEEVDEIELKWFSKANWQEREGRRVPWVDGVNGLERGPQPPFTKCKASDFLVSKRYFRSAAKAYISRQGIYSISFLDEKYGIIAAFISTLSVSDFGNIPWSRLPNLQTVELLV
ncbi:uncharacterized protein LTR77_002358 [Saxophila tyrrhenica]|uniref:F-box domain-containing protein n=1 Tax=Saxophila tyrrhenica TaxID=1690608 RepID=A0AAV9PIA1_9PEZI|nr:hypothetical protein LTR77_002358 [Saxophila tyrrhenica]